jgi:hypothetical protein
MQTDRFWLLLLFGAAFLLAIIIINARGGVIN